MIDAALALLGVSVLVVLLRATATSAQVLNESSCAAPGTSTGPMTPSLPAAGPRSLSRHPLSSRPRASTGLANGFAFIVRATGRQLRKVQTGYVRNYALGLTAGLVLILAYVLTRVS